MGTEEQRGETFGEQARPAPAGTRSAVRPDRRRIMAAAGGVIVLGAAVVAVGMNVGTSGAPIAAPAATVPAQLAGQPIVVEDGSGSCAYMYSPDVIAQDLDFAFDGTVVSVGEAVSQRPGDAGPWDYVGVTFTVNEWFKGGSRDTVTVDAPPSGHRSVEGDGSPSAYAPGTRLLMSGMARWGGGDPLAYPVAWFGCGGFSRFYSDEVADTWRAATR